MSKEIINQQLVTEYDYIYMKLIQEKPKTQIFDVKTKSSHTMLGQIKWHSSWRQYCFFPNKECVFSKSCLTDINDFIEQLMNIRKNNIHEEIGT